jgi:hypothetical protein
MIVEPSRLTNALERNGLFAGKNAFVRVGASVVTSIGDVVLSKQGYHTCDFFYPIGYKALRYYSSPKRYVSLGNEERDTHTIKI